MRPSVATIGPATRHADILPLSHHPVSHSMLSLISCSAEWKMHWYHLPFVGTGSFEISRISSSGIRRSRRRWTWTAARSSSLATTITECCRRNTVCMKLIAISDWQHGTRMSGSTYHTAISVRVYGWRMLCCMKTRRQGGGRKCKAARISTAVGPQSVYSDVPSELHVLWSDQSLFGDSLTTVQARLQTTAMRAEMRTAELAVDRRTHVGDLLSSSSSSSIWYTASDVHQSRLTSSPHDLNSWRQWECICTAFDVWSTVVNVWNRLPAQIDFGSLSSFTAQLKKLIYPSF